MNDQLPARSVALSVHASALALLSAASLICLFLMFGLEVPRNGPFRFGTTNDLLGAVYLLGLTPLVLHLGSGAALGRAGRVLSWIAAAGCILGAIAGFQLVLRLVGFDVSTGISVSVVLVHAAWVFWISRRYRRIPGFPRALGLLGQWMGLALLGGAALVGLGFLLPWQSWPQFVLFGLGGVPGIAAWCAWPAWLILLGRYLDPRRGGVQSVSPSP